MLFTYFLESRTKKERKKTITRGFFALISCLELIFIYIL